MQKSMYLSKKTSTHLWALIAKQASGLFNLVIKSKQVV